jgi:NAD(P)-dependent dehydrogenase (short-subunit alcohol dehydrogenase family)
MTTNRTLLTAGLLFGAAALSRQILRRRQALHLDGAVALITGGSRGLGLLIARELGRRGARVALAAREPDELATAQAELTAEGIDVSTVVADVCRPEDVQRMVDHVITRHGRLDVLINNAGVIMVGPMDEMTIADYEDAMATHFWGPLHAMRAALPFMRDAGGGRLVNVSSIGGRLATPHLAPYCASKFALTGLSTAFRTELRGEGILVTTVVPGLMRTGSPFNARFKGNHRAEFAWFAIADSLPLLSVSGQRAARQVVDALRHGDAEVVIGWPAKLAVKAAALAPRTTAAALRFVNSVLPVSEGPVDTTSRSGWQSTSRWAPSLLTRTTERAAARNNEVPHSWMPSPNEG